MPLRERILWTIDNETLNRILCHAVGEYPEEACGILLCHREMPWHIAFALPAENAASENLTKRYFVDPVEFLRVESWTENRGIDICGFYHSHPDQPSAPSEYDRELAWEDYLYFIVSIRNCVFEDLGVWQLDPEEERFREVILRTRT